MKKFLLAVLALATIAHAAPEIGQPAPAFTLKDETGAERSLADYKGKTVVLEWFNYGCPFVKKHYDEPRTMQKLQTAATADGVIWLAIVSSAPGKQGYLTPEQAAEKKKELGMDATAILLDTDGNVGRLYEARTTPEMFVINADGQLIYKGAIDDRPSASASSLQGARPYIAEVLASVKAARAFEPSVTKPYGCSVKY